MFKKQFQHFKNIFKLQRINKLSVSAFEDQAYRAIYTVVGLFYCIPDERRRKERNLTGIRNVFGSFINYKIQMCASNDILFIFFFNI